MNRKIYIADIQSIASQGKLTGHYYALARNYQEMFGERVVVAGGPVYTSYFKKNELLVLPYDNFDGGLVTRYRTFVNARKLFKETKGHIVVFQHRTIITTFLCLALFYHGGSKVYTIQYNKEGLRSKIGVFLFKLAKNKINGILCPNDIVGTAFSGIPYCVVPDYIYTGDSYINELSYSARKYDLCIVGRLVAEKGIAEIARKYKNTCFSLLIAGKPQSEEFANEIESICKESKNIELHLGFIPNEDYYSYLKNSKYAVLNYSSEYSERSSGVVYDTLFNGVPVIGRRCKALQFIEDNNLGILYDDLDMFDIKEFFASEKHRVFLKNISKYREKQKENVAILENFFNL